MARSTTRWCEEVRFGSVARDGCGDEGATEREGGALTRAGAGAGVDGLGCMARSTTRWCDELRDGSACRCGAGWGAARGGGGELGAALRLDCSFCRAFSTMRVRGFLSSPLANADGAPAITITAAAVATLIHRVFI